MVNGENLSNCLDSYWNDIISLVPQHIYLIDDTIENNICIGDDFATIDNLRLKRALDISLVSEFVSRLPDGVRTIVGERGAKLSGGQIQRIAIARAIYKKSAILILDEATSALDLVTEDSIMKLIISMEERPTLILITHRLSILEVCNKILKFDKQKLVEIQEIK